MSDKPYKDFEPQWIKEPPVEKSYRSIMKWGDPARYKRPKEGLYKLIKNSSISPTTTSSRWSMSATKRWISMPIPASPPPSWTSSGQ